MNFFQRRKVLKGVNYLELIPLRRYEHQSGENNTITVLTPRFENPFFKKYFVNRKKRTFVFTHLDEIGSAAWLSIDGVKNVQQICDTLSVELGDKIAPCEERMTRFLTQLYLDKFISFKEIEE